MANTITRLHHAAIVVQDLKASVAWYRHHLGFEHQYDFALSGAQVSMIVRGDARIELDQVEEAVPVPANR